MPLRTAMRRARGRVIGLAAAGGAAATLLSANVTGAAAALPDLTTAPQTTLSMQTVAATRALTTTPDVNGQVTIQLANGAQVAIGAAHLSLVTSAIASRGAVAVPDNRVGGNCGSSYIYVNHLSDGHPVHMDTGFDVNHLAVEYAWHAHIAGDSHTGYDYDYHASGWLDFDPGWHGQHASHKDYPRGYYGAGVYTDGTSWALLDNGDFCISGGPHDHRYL